MKLKKLKEYTAGLLIVLPVLAFVSCLGSDSNGGGSNLRNFNATDLTDYSNYVVTTRLVYEGNSCKVYKDIEDTFMNDTAAAAMGLEFDGNIYSRLVPVFGVPSDVDGDGKIILLILDIRDGGSDTSYVAGYFDPYNEFDPASNAAYQYSNECEMLYLDTNPGAENAAVFKETMAHEFQHLINFNQKVFVQGSQAGFDTWIDEGLSSAAERIYSGVQVQDKIDYFNVDYFHDIAKGQRFIAWDRGNYNTVLGSYSTVYLFFQWLNIQSTNDNSIYKVIVDSGYDDYRAVEAAKVYITGFTGSTFSDLLRDWNIANLLSQGSGLYGYKGEITTTVSYINVAADNPRYPAAGSTLNMLPGECVYAKATDTTLADTANIKAAGVDTAASTIDTDGTVYTGNVLIVYNMVSDAAAAASLTGALPPLSASVNSLKSVRGTGFTVKRYPVDRVLKPGTRAAVK